MTSQIQPKNMRKLDALKKPQTLDEIIRGVQVKEKIDKLLIVVFDTSGSMGEAMEQSTKIIVSWQIFKSQLAPNMSGWYYGIISFNNYAEWIIHPCQDVNAITTTRVPVPMGGTDMTKALDLAWQFARTSATQARFIVLTDGVTMDQERILLLAKEQKDIPIDTVGIGNTGSYTYDPEFLKELSRITGGIFCEAKSIKLLADTIQQLSPAQRPLLGTVKK